MWLNGSWYCAPRCLEGAVEQVVRALAPTPLPSVRTHRIPLGLLLISRGQLSEAQLGRALAAQHEAGHGRLGFWLQHLNLAAEAQITAALGLQWACPVLPSSAFSELSCAPFLPLVLLEQVRMLPIHWNSFTRLLYVAFSEGIDYATLFAIETMLHCRTEASLAGASAMELALQALRRQRRPLDFYFDGLHEPSETARIACGYALKLGAQEIRIVKCRDYVWTRLECPPEAANLLFRRSDPEDDLVPRPLSAHRSFGPAR